MSKDIMLISLRYLIILTSNVKVDIYMMDKEVQSCPKKKIGDQDHTKVGWWSPYFHYYKDSLVGRFVYLWIMFICLFCGWKV